MIQIFAEKSPGLFGRGSSLAPKFGAKRASLFAKRAGISPSRLATSSTASPKLPFAAPLDSAGNSLRRLAGAAVVSSHNSPALPSTLSNVPQPAPGG